MSHRKLGKAGELRVASELLLRGFSPSLACLDEGADIILDNGIKIQVKTARISKENDRSDEHRYRFNLKSWKTVEDRSKGVRRKQVPSDLSNVDFVVCWCVDDDVFYIIPAEVIKGKICVRITAQGKGRGDSPYEKYRENWNMLQRR